MPASMIDRPWFDAGVVLAQSARASDSLSTDLVRLDVGRVSYEWKVKDAERMVAELHGKIYTDG